MNPPRGFHGIREFVFFGAQPGSFDPRFRPFGRAETAGF